MKLETVAVADLKPLENNVRLHTDIQVKEFVRSLSQFGQTRPFVIDEDNNILIGNCMFLAMREAGTKSALAYRMKGLSEAKKKKLILSDNRIYSLGSDNAQAIENYIREIASLDDLNIAGFDEDVLKTLIRDTSEVEHSVMNYGKLPPEVVEKAQQTNTPASSAQTQTVQEDTRQEEPVAEVVQTVICPSCGEVIRI